MPKSTIAHEKSVKYLIANPDSQVKATIINGMMNNGIKYFIVQINLFLNLISFVVKGNKKTSNVIGAI